MSMTGGIVATLAGDSSSLTTYFHPELELDNQHNYLCALLDFTCKPLPNVNETNNKLFFDKPSNILVERWGRVVLPIGPNYSFEELKAIIEERTSATKWNFKLTLDPNTNKVTLKTSDKKVRIDFTQSGSMHKLLGFEPREYKGAEEYVGEHAITMRTIKSIRLECDLTTGTFRNGSITHTLHRFDVNRSTTTTTNQNDYIITEQPANLIYLPIIRRRISSINITAFDQDGEPLELNGGHSSCRIHIAKQC